MSVTPGPHADARTIADAIRQSHKPSEQVHLLHALSAELAFRAAHAEEEGRYWLLTAAFDELDMIGREPLDTDALAATMTLVDAAISEQPPVGPRTDEEFSALTTRPSPASFSPGDHVWSFITGDTGVVLPPLATTSSPERPVTRVAFTNCGVRESNTDTLRSLPV